MEDGNGRGDLQGNVVRQSSFRQGGSFKPIFTGKSTPKNCPSFQRLKTSRTPRREVRGSGGGVHWFQSNRLVRSRQKAIEEVGSENAEVEELDIPKSDTAYGLLVGPFGSTEDMILEWSPVKRSGTCDRKGAFAHLVWLRKFVLIFHELSMIGAPLSMVDLATELLSCGATASAVVLSKKGGLMTELSRRRIKVLEDKADLSFKTAMKADLVIAGSAVCASWIVVLTDAMSYGLEAKQWLTWCEEENIKLRYQPAVVPLSVTDELAFVAGIYCSLNSPSSTPEKMPEKRQLLRSSVRKEMGLTDNDMLMMSLSNINPGKGQLLLLEAARHMIEQETHDDHKIKVPVNMGKNQSLPAAKYHLKAAKHHLRALLENSNDAGQSLHEFPNSRKSFHRLNEGKKKVLRSSSPFTYVDETDDLSLGGTQMRRKVLSSGDGQQEQALKILIGSVGSKSNKFPYVKEILGFLQPFSDLSKSVIWTPATTSVASLYSAADVYVINSQGLRETFGRVTIKAMAFGLPDHISLPIMPIAMPRF
ncbi:hypothetical protein HS088_TW12G00332 [Tripterygium wilfordii]|uniref:Uncharacterized protein n=1 Tax=Tripterygium wilfordii TaxID=458696 RepID=A0A7J7CYF3_TRIWF|nr:hypothetical protein HS088_TW12G00332 [Tripterygium wilfordii]